jgi:hypothetical protein
MIVYFHIDELARDAVVASALKKELAAVGGRVVYGNRLTTSYLLRRFSSFDAIILPSLLHYTGAFPDTQRLPTNVFILPNEAVGQATGTLRRIFGKYFGDDAVRCEPWHRSVAGFLLWGHAHLNPFRDQYPKYLPKCHVVGHPRFARSCRISSKRKSGGKPVVGFVSRFNGLNPFDGRTPFETVLSNMRFGKERFTLYENSPDRDAEDPLYTEVIDFRIMLQIMMSLDSQRFEMTVRPHPRENRLGWIKLMKKVELKVTLSPWDEPFAHWLQKVDFVVLPPSTSLYDIFFHGKLPIVTNDIVTSRADHLLTESDDNNQILRGVCRPKSVAEVIARLESGDIPFDQELIRLKLWEQVGSDVADNSIGNIIRVITETVGQGQQAPVRQRVQRHAFAATSLGASHLRWFRGLLKRRVEQGSSFDLTLGRSRWITRLAHAAE